MSCTPWDEQPASQAARHRQRRQRDGDGLRLLLGSLSWLVRCRRSATLRLEAVAAASGSLLLTMAGSAAGFVMLPGCPGVAPRRCKRVPANKQRQKPPQRTTSGPRLSHAGYASPIRLDLPFKHTRLCGLFCLGRLPLSTAARLFPRRTASRTHCHPCVAFQTPFSADVVVGVDVDMLLMWLLLLLWLLLWLAVAVVVVVVSLKPAVIRSAGTRLRLPQQAPSQVPSQVPASNNVATSWHRSLLKKYLHAAATRLTRPQLAHSGPALAHQSNKLVTHRSRRQLKEVASLQSAQ